MADSVDWNVVLRLALQGASQTKQGLTEVQGAVDKLHKEGKIGEKQWEANSRAIARTGQTARTSAADHKNLNTSLISQRYALYDVAQTYGAYSAAVTAAGIATVTAFASQERAFTNVERTADGALGNIRNSLTELSTTIPLSFNKLAEIATLGNQLGVASQDIEAFTETIAQFSTVTGITADSSAQAFGKLGNLLSVSAQDYDRLASSIVYVGRTTAATEQQIISVAGEIAPAAAAAGFAADEVIGLSGALSSLRVPPERSRSTILQFFETLNMAVARGGDDLNNFAQIIGVTASELDAMVRAGQGQDILSRFISATAASDTIEVTQALDALGLAGLRTNPTIRALAGNTDLMAKALGDSKNAWTENTELQRQMDMILDDLSTKFQTAVNAVVNFAAAVGSQLAPVIGPVLDILKEVVITLTDFVNTPIGGAATQIVAVIGAITAGYAAYRMATALATAGTYALVTAQRGLAASGATTAIGQLTAGLATLTGASAGATAGVTGARIAITRLLAATGVGAVLVLLGAALTDLRGSALGAIDALEWMYNTFGKFLTPFRAGIGVLFGLQQAITGTTAPLVDFGTVFAVIGTRIAKFFQSIAGGVQVSIQVVMGWAKSIINIVSIAARNLAPIFQGIVHMFQAVIGPIAKVLGDFGEGFEKGVAAFDKASSSMFNGLRDAAKGLPSMLDDLTNAADAGALTDFGNAGDLAAGSLDGLGNSAADAAKKVYTLADYARDLGSVWSRAFDIRFGPQSTLDQISTSFQSIRTATEEATRAIARLKAEMSGINSDISIQTYFLGIAQQYGDTQRVAAIQATLSKLQADLADKTAELRTQQDAQSKTLVGNSAAAIQNRDQLRNLTSQYQAHIAALAASGLSQDQLAVATEQLRQDFIAQASQLGYNRAELATYEQGFYDVATAIRGVPRNITVDYDPNPALQALNEFAAQAQSVGSQIGGGLGNAISAGTAEGVRRSREELSKLYSGYSMLFQTGSLTPPPGIAKPFAEGGFTGRGGKYEPAGVVHRGEYVVPKRHVDQRTGLPRADALGRLSRGATSSRGYANGGFVGGGGGLPSTVSLSAMTIQQIAQAVQPHLILDGREVARSTSNQYAQSTAVGAA